VDIGIVPVIRTESADGADTGIEAILWRQFAHR